MLCLPFVTEVWQIYLLIFLLNGCSAGFTRTLQATIPDVVPDEAQYTRALSLSRLAYDLENLLSPTLAAAALLLLSYDTLFTVNAVAFLVSASLLLSASLPSPRPAEHREGVWHKLTFGTRAYLATPRLVARQPPEPAQGALQIPTSILVFPLDPLQQVPVFAVPQAHRGA